MIKINFKQPKYIRAHNGTKMTSGKIYLGCLKLILIMGYHCF